MKTSNMPVFLKTCMVGVNFKKMVRKPLWQRKWWKPCRSVTFQSFKEFEVLLCRCLSIMGYSWECGRLLLRICHIDFWFCGILTHKLVSKIFWHHWLYKSSRPFAWFSQKLQWFNKKAQFSFYSIWNIYSTSKTLPIRKKKKIKKNQSKIFPTFFM